MKATKKAVREAARLLNAKRKVARGGRQITRCDRPTTDEADQLIPCGKCKPCLARARVQKCRKNAKEKKEQEQ